MPVLLAMRVRPQAVLDVSGKSVKIMPNVYQVRKRNGSGLRANRKGKNGDQSGLHFALSTVGLLVD
jgi:hypothetical protein